MKKSDLIFSALLVPFDYLILVLAGIFVYYLRFNALVELRPVIYEIPFGRYLASLLIIFFFWILIFVLTGLYNLSDKRHFSNEISKIFLACTVGTMLIVLFIFFKGEYFSSRFIILAGWLMTIIFISFSRILIHGLQLFYYRHGKGLEPVLIFGQGETAEGINVFLKNHPGNGYQVIGWVKNMKGLKEEWSSRTKEISEIIQTGQDLSRDEILELVEFCEENQIIFKYTADTFNSLISNIRTETLAGIPIVVIKKTSLDGWGRILKRVVDIIFSFFALIFLSPLFLILAIIIKIDSKGTVFVKLKRVGVKRNIFYIYKFRSMINNAEKMKENLMENNERKEGPLFKIKNDPRITNFGKVLRKTSLDELPQLLNIFKGEMSIVGPRPHEPKEVSNYQKKQKQLLTIKPGLSGLAQISGRSELSFEEEAKLDIYYIENWSLGFDFKIIIKTIPVVIFRKNAS